MRIIRKTFLRLSYAVIYCYWFLMRPRVEGVQIILIDGDKIGFVRHTYMHFRRYDFPGGSVKNTESAETAAIRELSEEVGLRISRERLCKLDEMVIYHEFHYSNISVFMVLVKMTEVAVGSDEIEELKWVSWDCDSIKLSHLASEVWRHASMFVEARIREYNWQDHRLEGSQ